jgi:cytochrome P450
MNSEVHSSMSGAAATIDKFQPFDPAHLSSPHAGWALLRREAPVYRVHMPQVRVPVYLITRRQEIAHITSHPELFSNSPEPSIWRWGDFEEPEIAAVFKEAGYKVVPSLQTAEPPLAQQHRKLLEDALSRREVAALKADIAALIDQLIDGIESEKPFDFVDAYSVPLPLLVILRLLGIPYDQHDFFRKYTDEFAFLLDPTSSTARAAEAAKTIVAGYRYFEQEILKYRERPANNLMSAIANGRFLDDQPASMAEALSICNNTVIAGNETTRNSISSAMFLLARRPDLWQRLKSDRNLAPNFVEEILRYAAPANTTPRRVLADTELAGVKLSKGSCLFILWGSGSLDETVFDCPEAFDIERKNNRAHTTFGLGGRHCPGNILARAEITLSIQRWLDRFESVELAVPADQIHYEPIFGFHALGHLPMRVRRSK